MFKSNSNVKAVSSANGDGALIAGHKNALITYSWMTAIDDLGGIKWTKRIPADDDRHVMDALLLAGGEFLVAYKDALEIALLVKYAANGGQIWSKRLGKTHFEQILRLSMGHDSCYLLTGYEIDNGVERTWVYSLSPEGDSLWINHYSGGERGHIHHVLPNGDGYLLFGQKKSLGRDNYDYWLLGVGPRGEMLWENIIGDRWEDRLQHAMPCKNGGFLASGIRTGYDGGLKKYVGLVRIDQRGGILWDLKLEANDNCSVLQAWEEEAGQFKVAGKIEYSAMWINHLNAESLSKALKLRLTTPGEYPIALYSVNGILRHKTAAEFRAGAALKPALPAAGLYLIQFSHPHYSSGYRKVFMP